MFRVAPVTAGTRVLGADQHEIRREGQAALRAADGDGPVFEGLPQHFQPVLPELRHLVQEEHAAVRQADLAGPRPLAADDEAGVRDGVVRGAEGPVADQRDVAGQHAGDGVDARDVQRLGGGHAREDRGEGRTPAEPGVVPAMWSVAPLRRLGLRPRQEGVELRTKLLLLSEARHPDRRFEVTAGTVEPDGHQPRPPTRPRIPPCAHTPQARCTATTPSPPRSRASRTPR